MSNKYVKLTSKRREKPKSSYVMYDGVQMTSTEREALLRKKASEKKQSEAANPAPKPAVTKGQIIEQPTQRTSSPSGKYKKPGPCKRFFMWLFGRNRKPSSAPPKQGKQGDDNQSDKKQETSARSETIVMETTVVETPMKIVEESVVAQVVEAPRQDAQESAEEAVVEPADAFEAVSAEPEDEEIAAVEEAEAVEQAEAATIGEEEPSQQFAEAIVAEDREAKQASSEQVVELYQKLKRVPKLELLRFARQTAAGADAAIKGHRAIEAELERIETELKAAKTPKDASDDLRKELNGKRAALRKERDAFRRKGLIACEKAISLERASDEYSAVASWLLEKEVDYRKEPRLNPVDPDLSENIIPLSERVAHSSVPGVAKERIEELKETL